MKNSVFIGAVLLFGSLTAVAQSTPDSICEVTRVKAKSGTAKQLETGRKTHNNFHLAQKDKNSVFVWTLTSGPDFGQYLMTTCGLAWKDMDGREDFNAKDNADIARTMGPFIENMNRSYYVLRSDLGPKEVTPSDKLPKMISITTFYLKGDGAKAFTAAVKRIGEARTKSNYPSKTSHWYQLANGGDGPQFVLVGDRANWADMQGPDKTLVTMLEEVYGKDDTTLQSLRGAVRYTVSELADLHPELSYMPAK